MTTIETIAEQMKAMQTTMQSMRDQFEKDLQIRDDLRKTEGEKYEAQIQVLHTQLSSKNQPPGSSRQDERDFQKNISDAKEAIPELSMEGGFPGTYPEFSEGLKALLLLLPDVAKFLKDVDVSTTKLPEALDDLKLLVPPVATRMSQLSLCNIFTFLRSKIASDSKVLYESIPASYPKDVQLMMLYTSIMQVFGRNDEMIRDLAHRTFNDLTQENNQSFEDWAHVVKKSAERINTLYKTGVPGYAEAKIDKVDSFQIWGRIRLGMTEEVRAKVSSELTNMDTNTTTLSLSQKVNIISQKLASLNLHDLQYDQTVTAYMARTNNPTKHLKHSDSEYFRMLAHANTMKKVNPCFYFNGRPDSCAYGKECRFLHITNSKERAAALKPYSEDKRYAKLLGKQDTNDTHNKNKQNKNKNKNKNKNESDESDHALDSDEDSDSDDRRRRSKQRKRDAEYRRIGKAYLAGQNSRTSRVSSENHDNYYVSEDDEKDYAAFKRSELIRRENKSASSRADKKDSSRGKRKTGKCGLVSTGNINLAIVESKYDPLLDASTSTESNQDSSEGESSASTENVFGKIDVSPNSEVTSRRIRKKEKREKDKLTRYIQSEKDRRLRVQREIDKQNNITHDVLKQEQLEYNTTQRKLELKQKKTNQHKSDLVDDAAENTQDDNFEEDSPVGKNESLTEHEQMLTDQIWNEHKQPTLNEKQKPKKKKKKTKTVSSSWKSTFFIFVRMLTLVLVSISLVARIGGESFIKYVGFGFVPQSQAASTIHIDNTTMNVCYMARKGRGPGNHVKQTLRVIDGGSTWHLSGEENVWVGPRKKLSRPKMIYGFDAATTKGGITATESGTIKIPTIKNGRHTTIKVKNVLYVPAIGNTTLISQGCLDDRHYKFTVAHGVTSCYNGKGELKWQAHKKDGLYHLDAGHHTCLLSKQEAHARFGHINEKQLASLGDFDGELSP
jgi:hypothetical protein